MCNKESAQGRHLLCLYLEIVMLKSDKVHKFKELKEINLAIMSKPHAYPQTMKTTHSAFQNNLHKIVRGVALTRHPLFI